jgi:ketosteroid isomerase-like protein
MRHRFHRVRLRVRWKIIGGEGYVGGAENIDIARQYVAALSAGAGPDEVARFYAADVVQEEFPNRLMPHGATRDLQAMKEGRVRGQALLGAENFELLNAIAEGDRVALEVMWTATVSRRPVRLPRGSRCAPASPSSWSFAMA